MDITSSFMFESMRALTTLKLKVNKIITANNKKNATKRFDIDTGFDWWNDTYEQLNMAL